MSNNVQGVLDLSFYEIAQDTGLFDCVVKYCVWYTI